MASYQYNALDSRGDKTTGTIEASNEADALQKLRAKNLYPTQVAEAGQGDLVKESDASSRRKKGKGAEAKKRISKKPIQLKKKQVMMFTRQTATLITAGLPLLRSLTVLGKQEPNPMMKRVLDSLADAVQGGNTFSQGLAQFPLIFDKLYVNMVKAGELGGVLEIVLTRLAEYMEKAEKLKNKIVSAMVYPMIVVLLAVGIMTFLMLFIVPKFKAMLPLLSQIVFGFSDLMIQRSFILPNALWILGGLMGVIVFISKFRKTEKGKDMFDRLLMKIPLFGNLIEKTAIARFTRTLGTLISSGVPILQALNIAKETAGNVVYSQAIGSIHDAVKEGEPLVTPMQATKVFPPMVVSMVDVGEETGQLPDMLMKIADLFDEEVDTAVTALTSIIEPLMIVALALVVGVIVMALFLPLIKMIQNLE